VEASEGAQPGEKVEEGGKKTLRKSTFRGPRCSWTGTMDKTDGSPPSGGLERDRKERSWGKREGPENKERPPPRQKEGNSPLEGETTPRRS